MEIIPFPGFSEPFSSWTHLLACGVAMFGTYVLCKKGRGNSMRMFALIVFSISLIFLFSMSGVYHLLEPGGAPREVFKHLDHAAIWVLIAGSFTPIHAILFRGRWRWGIILLVWTIAVTGVVLKTVFFTGIPEWLGLIFYLGMGWLGVASGYKIKSEFNTEETFWLLLGGIAYSVGAILDFIRWPVLVSGVIGPHEVFHIFVILGALSHWMFVYKWSSHPVADIMIFHVQVFPDNRHVASAVGDTLLVEANNLEDLHIQIKKMVRVKYHKNIIPKIHLRYSKEEILS